MKLLIPNILIILLVFSVKDNFGQNKLQSRSSKMYTSWLPAPSADQALLLGNGTMGAMVYGHPHNETVILNHADLYLPIAFPRQTIDQASSLNKIRELILNGQCSEAAKIPVDISFKEGYTEQMWSDPYIPAFDLKINTTPGNIDYYKRSVNFENGEALVSWEQNGHHFQRSQFISRADSLMLIRIKADTVFDANFSFSQRPVAWNQWDYINENIKSTRAEAKGNMLYFKSDFVKQWEGNIASYEGVGKIICVDGDVQTNGNRIDVKNTQDVLLLIKIESYVMGEDFNTPSIEAFLNEKSLSYNELLTHQENVHGEIFNRITLDLGGSDADTKLDAEVMMQDAKQGFNPAFVERQFYAARYNILSATGKNPPNLQGIWGSDWQPPWSSDYTHDGNLPVAISSFLCSNMPELMASFFNYHDARMDDYRTNAKRLYNCRGIQVPSHSSAHGLNVHFDPIWCLSFWNGGAAWTAHFYYDYYLYTNDKNFLAKRAYPFMKEAALFYEDFLSLDDNNHYVFNPSYSPENSPANSPSQATINATMDIALAKELLRNLISAGKVLNEDKKQLAHWSEMLAQMPAYEVDATGDFREWLWDGYEENHHHRHISQLYGMYDLIDPEIANDPILWQGVKKTVQERMKVRRQDDGGVMVFGMVQMAWVAANLGDEALVEDILSWLSAQYWSNSLATYHDPNGLFNMDLSGGFQSAIIRSLVYSEPGLIAVLPAKPLSWKQGSIKGVLARNQIIIEALVWSEKEVVVQLKSANKQGINLQLPKNTSEVSTLGKALKITKNTRNDLVTQLDLPASESVEIKITIN